MLNRKKLHRCSFYMITLLIVQILIAIWKTKYDLSWDQLPVIIYWPPVGTNIQCYRDDTKDALQSVDDPSFSPKSKSIFFHETSCRGGIDSRQACAVESAARANPEWDVYLLFTGPVTDVMMKRSCLVKLLEFPNIKLARIHINSYAKFTTVEAIVEHRLWKSLQPVQHTADIMKVLTLDKWAGISIDLDVLVVQSLNSLPDNWIAKGSPYRLAAGVIRFSRDEIGQNLTIEVLKEIASTYNELSFNTASKTEEVLLTRCKNALFDTGNCTGITIFTHKWFYPISLQNASLLLQEGPSSPNPLDEVKGEHLKYTYCMWNVMTGYHKVHQNSTYVEMAKNLCPTIYQMYGCEFGV